ncbi:MAG: YdcF family protein [Eubacteriales bacterium]|nr:YdcF family protein [Eubacteriales bacterium]
MEAIFFLLSILCLVYFVIIVAYSGIGTAFCGVWIFFAAVLAMMGYFSMRKINKVGSLPKRLPVFVFTSFVLGVIVFSVIMNFVIKESRKAEKPGLNYVVVLGAKVYPDGISKSLKKRLDKAYEYHLENPDTIFVLSGGQGSDEVVPEALAMYNYLHLKGIPEEKLLIEMNSRNTLENIVFSKKQIDMDRKKHYYSAYPDPLSIGILTSDFHVMRAVKIAKKQGYKNVYGIAAPSDSILFVHMCVRESAAIIKDYLMGNL